VALVLNGSALAAIGKLLLDFRKGNALIKINEARVNSELSLAKDSQTVAQWERIASSLETRVGTVEKDLGECRTHHAKCERELGETNGRIDELRRQLEHLTQPAVNIQVNDSVKKRKKKSTIDVTEASS
jgi:phage shock protein A